MPDREQGSFLRGHLHSLGKNQCFTWVPAAVLSQVGVGKWLLFHIEISSQPLCVWRFRISPPSAPADWILIQLYFLLQMLSVLWLPYSHFIGSRYSIPSPGSSVSTFCSAHCYVSAFLKFPFHYLSEVLGEN